MKRTASSNSRIGGLVTVANAPVIITGIGAAQPLSMVARAQQAAKMMAGPIVPAIFGGWMSPKEWSFTLVVQPVSGMDTPKPRAISALCRLFNLYRMAFVRGEWSVGGGEAVSGGGQTPVGPARSQTDDAQASGHRPLQRWSMASPGNSTREK